MRCNPGGKSATYGSRSYCTKCGMDLGLNPVVIWEKGTVKLFCCEECAR